MHNLKEKTDKRPLNRISFFFSINLLFTENFSRMTFIHQGIFRTRALWADSVSPRMSIIMSRDQFKPIRIGENLVVIV